MRIAIAIGVFATLLTISLLVWFFARRRIEGFAAEAKAKKAPRIPNVDNVLLALMAQLKRMMGYVSNPADWIERIQIMKMTPAELARRHLSREQTE